jgi:N-acetyl-alpha-D-glucosaminyl L-malate synthase BshA
MKPLNIGIACYPTYGGSGVLATELGLALADAGHNVHLFSYARPTRLSAWHKGIEFHCVSVSSYPLFRYPPYDLALSTIMRQVMVDHELDILHVHYAVPHAICAYVAREMVPDCRTRIITTLHGTDATILGRDPAYADVIRFGLDKSDAVVCVSDWLENQTRDLLGFTGNVDVLPNFVDHSRFKPPTSSVVREQLGGKDNKLIVHMSNFRSLKRTPDTIEVLDRIPDDIPAKLLLVGDGPDQALVRDLASQKGLCHKVEFLGEIDEVESIIAAADVALFPSESESFGLSMLEAQACGVPVVTTNVGGLPEVIQHGVTGYLDDVGDCEGMAQHVETLLRDEPLRQSMGVAGAERARRLFSLESSMNQHVALYERLLAEAP